MMNLPARLLGDLADTERSLGHCWSAEDWDLVVIIDYHESINMFVLDYFNDGMVWYGMGDDYHESIHNDDNNVCFQGSEWRKIPTSHSQVSSPHLLVADNV